MAILSSLLCAFVSIGFPDQSLGHDGRTANPIGRRNDTAVALNTAIAADQFSPDFTGKNGVRHQAFNGLRCHMFDGQDKSLFFIGLLLAGFISIAGQSRAPDIDMDVAVDTAVLPAVPLTAGPDGTPAQVAVARQTVDLGGGFFATLMYGYALEGVVVTRRQFRWDATSPVSPLDLGIVWGDLADPGATAEVSFRTGQRAVFYRADPGAVLPPRWEEQITNNHLIPATPEVHAALMAVAPGYRVRLRGYLVTVTGEAIRPWRSSTRRDDNTIIGGCEIILVREVEVLPPAEA